MSLSSKILVIAFFWMWSIGLNANLHKHLRKIEDKSGFHSMPNVDFIYLINLDERPERLKRALDQLESQGICPLRFSAVDGWKLSLQAINDLGLNFTPQMREGEIASYYPSEGNGTQMHEKIRRFGRAYFSYGLTRGEIGCALSHLSILQDAYQAGYETIWIMEDDIELISDPWVIPELIGKLDELVGKENWDILFTDRDAKFQSGEYVIAYGPWYRPDFLLYPNENRFDANVQISPDFRKIGARFGTHSMICRRGGIKKLLEFFHTRKIFWPYDVDLLLPPGINLYTVMEDIVSVFPESSSDTKRFQHLDENDFD